jgi:hypothetical protein
MKPANRNKEPINKLPVKVPARLEKLPANKGSLIILAPPRVAVEQNRYENTKQTITLLEVLLYLASSCLKRTPKKTTHDSKKTITVIKLINLKASASPI